MKLYSLPGSFYAARCRAVIYAKGLEVELVVPPGGLGSEAYRAINPLGGIPALDVGGWLLPESDVICEYLEERFPRPALLPADPARRARARLLSRFVDLYLGPSLTPAYRRFRRLGRRGLGDVELAEAEQRFDQLEGLLELEPYAAGERLSIADCALAPTVYLTRLLLRTCEQRDPLEGRIRLSRWWGNARRHGAIAQVLREITARWRQHVERRLAS